ncbi:hypothetical protein D3C80_1613780 [compost metagenome]
MPGRRQRIAQYLSGLLGAVACIEPFGQAEADFAGQRPPAVLQGTGMHGAEPFNRLPLRAIGQLRLQ